MDTITLDKGKFSQKIALVALEVPATLTSKFLTPLKDVIWRRTKPVLASESDPMNRIILFDQTISQNDKGEVFGLSPAQNQLIAEQTAQVKSVTLEVGYDNMTTDEILKQIVPPGIEVVTAFETIGHIAHLNLRDDCYPYRKVIGQVILDKNKAISTVVNKTGEIDTVFRTFKMELLAGEDRMDTEVSESNCRFQFNFAQVYWNSRLGTEHGRLVKMFKPSQVVVDMFCGVGPFAIPASKELCFVHANDLNPYSHQYLQHNVKLNKCNTEHIKCYNMDGREFIQQLVVEGSPLKLSKNISHIIMNLPASAVTFLDVFNGLFPDTLGLDDLPTIHCYGFSKAADPVQDMIEQAEKHLGHKILNPHVFNVRTVSTKKFMMRISFKLPQTACSRHSQQAEEPLKKRQKTEIDQIDEDP